MKLVTILATLVFAAVASAQGGAPADAKAAPAGTAPAAQEAAAPAKTEKAAPAAKATGKKKMDKKTKKGDNK